jgi:hypothetical protein
MYHYNNDVLVCHTHVGRVWMLSIQKTDTVILKLFSTHTHTPQHESTDLLVYTIRKRGSVGLKIRHWTPIQRVVGSNPVRSVCRFSARRPQTFTSAKDKNTLKKLSIPGPHYDSEPTFNCRSPLLTIIFTMILYWG